MKARTSGGASSLLIMGNSADQGLVQTQALCLRVCVLFLENLGHLFFLQIVEPLPLTKNTKQRQRHF